MIRVDTDSMTYRMLRVVGSVRSSGPVIDHSVSRNQDFFAAILLCVGLEARYVFPLRAKGAKQKARLRISFRAFALDTGQGVPPGLG